MLIPKFSWWYYKSIADEVDGHTLQYPLYEDGNTFKYDFAAMKEMVQRENPKVLLIGREHPVLLKFLGNAPTHAPEVRERLMRPKLTPELHLFLPSMNSGTPDGQYWSSQLRTALYS